MLFIGKIKTIKTDYQELELLVCGMQSIDLGDWQRYTVYEGLFADEGSDNQVHS